MPHTRLSVFLLALLASVAFNSSPAHAGALIDLSAEASRPTANDMAQASVYAEASGANPAELSRQVNHLLGDALKTAGAYPTIKAQSGQVFSYPVYGKAGKIEAWRMRSELILESRDTSALSALLGKLQTTLGVSRVALQPSPETRKKAETEALLDAIAGFEARAAVIAGALGKPYRIKQLSINNSGRPPVMPMLQIGRAHV
mgnify:CR=1 FL=1